MFFICFLEIVFLRRQKIATLGQNLYFLHSAPVCARWVVQIVSKSSTRFPGEATINYKVVRKWEKWLLKSYNLLKPTGVFGLIKRIQEVQAGDWKSSSTREMTEPAGSIWNQVQVMISEGETVSKAVRVHEEDSQMVTALAQHANLKSCSGYHSDCSCKTSILNLSQAKTLSWTKVPSQPFTC